MLLSHPVPQSEINKSTKTWLNKGTPKSKQPSVNLPVGDPRNKMNIHPCRLSQ